MITANLRLGVHIGKYEGDFKYADIQASVWSEVLEIRSKLINCYYYYYYLWSIWNSVIYLYIQGHKMTFMCPCYLGS